MDVSNSGLSSTIRLPIERQTAETQDSKRQAKDSDIERRELERTDEGRQDTRHQQRHDDQHRVDIQV